MMILINKLIISNRFLRHTPFWWWYRLINHEGFRFDDYYVWGSFWSSLNGGWLDMQYEYEYFKVWEKGHANGLEEVYNQFYDLVELIKD
jgi:hypothetical protein